MDSLFIIIALAIGVFIGWIIRKFYIEKDFVSKTELQKLVKEKDIIEIQKNLH